jgi:hypothetical protein
MIAGESDASAIGLATATAALTRPPGYPLNRGGLMLLGTRDRSARLDRLLGRLALLDLDLREVRPARATDEGDQQSRDGKDPPPSARDLCDHCTYISEVDPAR